MHSTPHSRAQDSPLGSLSRLATPSLVLDLDVLERNLEHMAVRARRLGVRLRPHVKTHKCPEIARLQRDLGASGITVSTLAEAVDFAAAGFTDLTWAFPVILGRLAEARRLAERVELGLTLDSQEAMLALENDGFPWRVWLKVDCGYHRAGVDPESPRSMELARRLSGHSRLRFAGLLSHSGHAYAGGSPGAAKAAADEERQVMVAFAERLRREGIAVPEVSVGSTPGMAVVEDLEGVTEARPGNYAFYDGTQVRLGSCTVADCAVTVLASVVSRPAADRSIIDAGALALSKDPGLGQPASWGEIYADDRGGSLRPDARLVSLSQEHGIVNAGLDVGSQVRILPNHSCLTVACFDEYAVVRGADLVGRWKIYRRR